MTRILFALLDGGPDAFPAELRIGAGDPAAGRVKISYQRGGQAGHRWIVTVEPGPAAGRPAARAAA